jgi:hypothetical protein
MTGAADIIDVTDDETRLTVAIRAASISESGGSTTGTIRRTGSLSRALRVNLSSNDTTEARVPSSVTIPAGASTVSFAIRGIDDTIVDGNRTVRITVSASGFASVVDTLVVTDNERRASLSLVASQLFAVPLDTSASGLSKQLGNRPSVVTSADQPELRTRPLLDEIYATEAWRSDPDDAPARKTSTSKRLDELLVGLNVE